MSIDLGLTINIARSASPLPTGNFSLPLVLGMSGNGPQDRYDEFVTQDDVENNYDPANHLHITAHTQAIFDQGADKVAVYNVSRGTPSSGDLSTALDSISNQPFFYVVSTSRNGTNPDSDDASGDRTDVSDWAESNFRQYIATNEISETPSDQKSDLSTLSNERTYWLAFENTNLNEDNLDNPVNAALAGYASVHFPGSVNFKWATLENMSVSNYSPSEVSDIEDEGGHAFVEKRSYGVTSGGESTDTSTFFDVPIIESWLKDNLEARLVQLLAQEPKVGFDKQGLTQVDDAIRAAFEEGADNDLFIISELNVDVPDFEDLTQSDRSDRVLNDVTFQSLLETPISDIDIDGEIIA